MLVFLLEDINNKNRFKKIIIRNIDDDVVSINDAPNEGWTKDSLFELSDEIESNLVADGLNAYMDDEFIGTTEI